jgi:putative membrane protein insertion efficiency factor
VLTWTLRGVIRLYQLLLSPVLPPRCRFLPSCSDYAMEALATHGALAGTALALRRLLRCHPWGGSGYDPVPPADRRGFRPSHLLPSHHCGAAHPDRG